MHRWIKGEKIRFLAVGCFNTVFDFLLFNAMFGIVGLKPLVANTISVTIGITISYLLNHYFVFKSSQSLSFLKYIHFFVVTGFSSLIIQNSVIFASEKLTHSSFGQSLFIINELSTNQTLEINIAKALAVLLGMVWNFMLYKYVIFKKDIEDEF